MSKKGVSFKPIGWKKAWNEELDKLYSLKKSEKLEDRYFFQKDNFLFIKYVFESSSYVILPMEFVEEEKVEKGEDHD